jgi:hypothetical protein
MNEKAAPLSSTIITHGVDPDEKSKAMLANPEGQVYKAGIGSSSRRRTAISEVGVLEYNPSECRFDHCAKFSYPQVCRSNEAETVSIAHEIVGNNTASHFQKSRPTRILKKHRPIGSCTPDIDIQRGRDLYYLGATQGDLRILPHLPEHYLT